MKVLVVNKSSAMRRIIANCLKPIRNVEVLEGTNGRDALQKLASSQSIDLIIADWLMPEMNILELVREVNKVAAFNGIPIIIIATELEKSNFLQALKVDANNYIIKPFKADVLRSKIKQVTNQLGDMD